MITIRPFLSKISFPRILWLFIALLTIAPANAAPEDPKPTEVQPAEVKPTEATYVLRANDVIRLDVYEEPDLSTSVQILKTGQASFPLIGAVEISGLSVSVAANKIRELFISMEFLVDPKVNLAVSSYATEYVSVIGEVRSPGQIPIPVSGKLDLATAMATCGGPNPSADVNRIMLVRESGPPSAFTMASITSGASGRVELASGDRIIVSQSAYVGKSITVLGMVGRQGPMAFPVSGKLDLVQAIAFAGGLTPLANPKKVSINRKGTVTVVDYKEISQRGDRPYPLLPDDIVIVAERIF